VADNWSGWSHVVWSTWNTEPKVNIDYIKSKGIEVLLLQPPSFAGDINVNYQVLSTFHGIQYLQTKNVTEVLKIRSDYVVSDIKGLLECLWGRKLAFMTLANIDIRRDITYELGYTHEGHDYPNDNVIYGEINNMLMMFNFQTDRLYGIPPESLILYNYLVAKNIPINFDFDHLIKNGITFFLRDCLKRDIKMYWLKKNQEIVQLSNNEYCRF
jgi:hypothetical protein